MNSNEKKLVEVTDKILSLFEEYDVTVNEAFRVIFSIFSAMVPEFAVPECSVKTMFDLFMKHHFGDKEKSNSLGEPNE